MTRKYGKIMWVDDDFFSLVDNISVSLTKKYKLKRKISKTDITKFLAEEIKRKGWFV